MSRTIRRKGLKYQKTCNINPEKLERIDWWYRTENDSSVFSPGKQFRKTREKEYRRAVTMQVADSAGDDVVINTKPQSAGWDYR